MTKTEQKYTDIINLPHHTSPTRPRMSMLNRAAQFSPFSALTGYGDAVDETIRMTDEQIEIDEETKAMLNLKLQFLLENPQTEAVFTYFQKDKKKSGGAYVNALGFVKDLDELKHELFLTDGTRIPVENVYAVESAAFGRLEMD